VTESQTRFLKAIAASIPMDRIVEVYIFPAIRSGQVETGAAVVAADIEPAPLGGPVAAEPVGAEPVAAESVVEPATERDAVPAEDAIAAVAVHRLTIWSARYRLTIKGPDRGAWECDVVAEADAPLVTMDAVVRGVQERSGEAVEPERLTADQFRVAISDTPWATQP
jgi:hypothetical protein